MTVSGGMRKPTSRYGWPLASFRAAMASPGSGFINASLRFVTHRAGSRDRPIGYTGAIRRSGVTVSEASTAFLSHEEA